MVGARSWLWLLALSVGCSCGDDDDGGDGDRVTAIVGANGGSLSSADGRLTLTVPPGALDHEVELSIEPAGDGVPALPGLVGVPYRLGPPGTTFAEPATLVFRVDAGAVGDRVFGTLRVATASTGLAWSCIPMSGVDEGASLVIAAVTHLSDWAVRLHECEGDQECEAPERCVSGGSCAIPCMVDGDCHGGDSNELSCVDGVCARATCADGSGCGELACSAADGPGVCLPSCTPRSRCGSPDAQRICTAGGRCVFDTECSEGIELEPAGRIACGAIEGFEERPCLHGWCIPEITGCDCATPGCPCFEPGGDGDADADADGDVDADVDGDVDGDVDADADADVGNYCTYACAVADDCCGGAGCSLGPRERWECRGGFCQCMGCLTDEDCGGGELCFQQAHHRPRGQNYSFDCTGLCARPCPNGNECDFGQECRTDPEAEARGLLHGGEAYCRDPSFDCRDGDSCGFFLQCEQATGACTCNGDDRICENHLLGTQCQAWPCDLVSPGSGATGESCADDRDCDSERCCVFAEDCADTPACTCE